MKKAKPKVETFDFFDHAARVLGPARMQQVEARIRKSMLSIRLAELREAEGLSQSDVQGFSQPSVSKIESREDMRLSKLTQYLDSLHYDLKVVALPRRRGKAPVVLMDKPGAKR